MTAIVEYDGFFDAARARQISLGQASGNNDVLEEINTLQGLISAAASSGSLELVVTAASLMTNSQAFFDSWNDPYNNDLSSDKLNRVKMNAVVNYFSRLGYTIRRFRVLTSNFFEWKIEW